jgi:hypothetical protein
MSNLDDFSAETVEETKGIFGNMLEKDKQELEAACRSYYSQIIHILSRMSGMSKLADQIAYEDTFCGMGMSGLCNLADDASIRKKYCVVGDTESCPAKGEFQ